MFICTVTKKASEKQMDSTLFLSHFDSPKVCRDVFSGALGIDVLQLFSHCSFQYDTFDNVVKVHAS